jgi:hypothetical protein
MSDAEDIPDGMDEIEDPITTKQEAAARARAGWEKYKAVLMATEEQFEDVQPYLARRYYARYTAYKDAGFSAEEAMDLLKAVGIEEDDE